MQDDNTMFYIAHLFVFLTESALMPLDCDSPVIPEGDFRDYQFHGALILATETD